MARHRALVEVEVEGGVVTIRVRCDSCPGGTLSIATAHLQTLARVLPKVCAEVGIDLNDGVTETQVFNLAADDARRMADLMYQEFLARRKAGGAH